MLSDGPFGSICRNLYELEKHQGSTTCSIFRSSFVPRVLSPLIHTVLAPLLFYQEVQLEPVKTASKLLSPAPPFLSWFKQIYFHVPSGSGYWLWSPLLLFPPPFSLLLSIPDKKSREAGFCSKQQEDFVALISTCKLRLTKVQTSLCDNSTAWPNLNEIYKIYLYK